MQHRYITLPKIRFYLISDSKERELNNLNHILLGQRGDAAPP